MIESEGAIRPVLVNRRHPRYAIADDLCPISPTMCRMGTGDDRRTADDSDAVRWAYYGGVVDAIRAMETAEPDDSPGAR
jgi:hypothetical protein